ncbi:MAG: hypothetical protein Q7K33_02590 [Candidatus Berkelbacteria bacterium]|nr:hypothetical protein [Candidatus Berkelbacteria bacterium]
MAEEELPENLGNSSTAQGESDESGLSGAGAPGQPVVSGDVQPEDDFGERVSDNINTAQNVRDIGRWGKKKFGPKEAEGLEGGVEKGSSKAKGGKKGPDGVDKAKNLKRVPTAASRAGATGGEAAGLTGGQAAATVGGEAAAAAGAAEAGATVGSVVPVVGTAIGLAVGWLVGKLLPKAINFIKNNWTKPVYVIAGVFLLLAIPFGLIGLKGGGQYPSTQAQQQQATLVSAIAGDLIAGKKVTQEGVDKIKGYYRDLVQTARSKNAAKAAEAEKRFKALGDQLDQLINLSGDPQKKLLAQIKAEEKQIFKDFPDLFPVGGTCAELKPFIDSGQFKIGSVNGKSNAKNVVEGVLANKIGEVWPASPGLCATLVYLLKNGVKIGTNTFSLGHEKYSGNKTSGTTISQHWCGEAIDIQSIDGVHVGKNEPTRKAMQLIKQGWMAKVGAHESFGPFYDLQLNDGRSYSKDIGGHDDHIHLSGPPLNKSCYGKR